MSAHVPTGEPCEIAVLGSRSTVRGYALAAARVLVAEDDDGVREAWRSLSPAVGIVLLSEEAASALATEIAGPDAPLTAVLPS